MLAKTEKPIVGFCCQNNNYRSNLINTLQNNNNLQTNFIIRNKFWGGIPNDPKFTFCYL